MSPVVLLVEDDAQVRKVIGDILQLRGFEVLAARDDIEAYRILEKEARRIDVLVADVDLGAGTTGFDVARRGRALNPALGVIYCTGKEKFRDTFAVTGSLLCPKPLNPERLADAAETLIAGA
jgi:DNA-binding NtrC family response regulator